jgi:hypothetical protein
MNVRRLILMLAFAALAAKCCPVPKENEVKTVATPTVDLIFLGTIETIENSPLENSTTNWVVTFKVDRVLSGEFENRSFAFRIHSPSMSGLDVGKQYKVEAQKTSSGYEVDQYQWIKRSGSEPAVPRDD